MKSLKKMYGNWALLTGSTVGIGQAFAQLLAEEGINLVTVARSEDALHQQAEQFKKQYGIDVRPISADLATPQGVHQVISSTSDLSIDILILNAGIIDAQHTFIETPESFCQKMLNINTTSVMQLSHHFANLMSQQKRGAILFLSSISGLMPQPYMSLYAATKAFVRSLATSIGPELKEHGVHVSVLSPGPVRTKMLIDIGMKHEKIGFPVAQPLDVARYGLNALRNRRLHVIPGWVNRLATATNYIVPDHYAAQLISWIMQKGFVSPPRSW